MGDKAIRTCDLVAPEGRPLLARGFSPWSRLAPAVLVVPEGRPWRGRPPLRGYTPITRLPSVLVAPEGRPLLARGFSPWSRLAPAVLVAPEGRPWRGRPPLRGYTPITRLPSVLVAPEGRPLLARGFSPWSRLAPAVLVAPEGRPWRGRPPLRGYTSITRFPSVLVAPEGRPLLARGFSPWSRLAPAVLVAPEGRPWRGRPPLRGYTPITRFPSVLVAPEGRPLLARGFSPWSRLAPAVLVAPEGRPWRGRPPLRGYTPITRFPSQGLKPLANNGRPSGATRTQSASHCFRVVLGGWAARRLPHRQPSGAGGFSLR